jgi:hypothetical protein
MGLVKRTVGLLSVALVAMGALLVANPGQAAAAPRVCTDEDEWGGRWYCKYGMFAHSVDDGAYQVWVIGTDYAVWTRWRAANGAYSQWQSMGGQIIRTGDNSHWIVCDTLLVNLTVQVVGTDGKSYYRTRQDNGIWTAPWRVGKPCYQ